MRRLTSLVLILAFFCNIAHAGFGGFLQANTAVDVIVGPFIDDTDGKTAETGLTVTQAEVRLSKNGGNMAQKTEATSLTHDELGNYVCKLDTTDTNTEGILTLMVHESGALAVKIDYQVLAQAAYISFMTAKDTGYMGVDVEEVDGTDQTGNDNGADINTIVTAVGNIETDTGTTLDDFLDTEISSILTAVEKIDTNTELRTLLTGADTPVAKETSIATAQSDLDIITGAAGVVIATDTINADALNTDFVTEIWAAAMSDLAAGAPSATASVLTAINWIYEAWRNKTITNGTNNEIELYKDDGSTKVTESDISDDGTDFTKGEYGAVD